MGIYPPKASTTVVDSSLRQFIVQVYIVQELFSRRRNEASVAHLQSHAFTFSLWFFWHVHHCQPGHNFLEELLVLANLDSFVLLQTFKIFKRGPSVIAILAMVGWGSVCMVQDRSKMHLFCLGHQRMLQFRLQDDKESLCRKLAINQQLYR